MLKLERYGTHTAAALFILSVFVSLSTAESMMARWEIIPGGEVTLGSDDEEKAYGYSIGGAAALRWRWYDVEVERTVLVDDFMMDRWPVLQAEYLSFITDTGHRRPYISEAEYEEQGFLVHSYDEVKPYLWRRADKDEIAAGIKTAGGYLPPKDKYNHPVVLVSVADAEAYCSWRGGVRDDGDGKEPGLVSRLPTEDEWEKAARGTDGRYFPWGSKWDDTKANIWQSGPHGTTPATAYKEGRSPYGIYDMAGNVFEWTSSPFIKGGGKATLKSCSWDDRPGICRAAARHGRPPDSRHILIGFRCASFVR